MDRRSFLRRAAGAAAALVALPLVSRFKPDTGLVAYWDDVALDRIAPIRKGRLLSAVRFDAPRELLAGDTLNIEYRLSIDDSVYRGTFKCLDGARADMEGECGIAVPPGPAYGACLREFEDGERRISVFTRNATMEA